MDPGSRTDITSAKTISTQAKKVLDHCVGIKKLGGLASGFSGSFPHSHDIL